MKKPIERRLGEQIVTAEECSQLHITNSIVRHIVLLSSIAQNGIIILTLYALRLFWQIIAFIYKLVGK